MDGRLKQIWTYFTGRWIRRRGKRIQVEAHNGPHVQPGGIDEVVEGLARLKTNLDDLLLLVASDGRTVRASKKALRRFAFFENLLNEQPALRDYRTDVSDGTLAVFVEFINGGPAVELANAFEPVLFSGKIFAEEFARYCCEAAEGVHAPESSSVDEVCAVVKLLISWLPTRTFEHYETVLNSVTGHLSLRERDLVIDAMVEAVQAKRDLVAPLPLPLFTKRVTVALMTDPKRQPLIVVLHANNWLPINLFGAGFCPATEQVKRFHLVFGRYIVYEKIDGSVMIKNLTSDKEPAQMLFENCRFFRSRCNQLHLIHRDEVTQTDSLYEWNHRSKSFDRRFEHPTWRFVSAHRRRSSSSGRLVLVLDNGSLVEFVGSTPVSVSNEQVDDCIERCERPTGSRCYTVDMGGGHAKRHGRVLGPISHIGYTRLDVTVDVHCSLPCVYRTSVFSNADWTVAGHSSAHGPVTSFSDVLLL